MLGKHYFDIDLDSNYDLYRLPNFGIFCHPVSEAATMVSRIMLFQGQFESIDDFLSYEDSYSIYDDKYDQSLQAEIEKFKKMFLLGIERKTLKAKLIRYTEKEEIDPNRTYINMRKLAVWLDDREIDISGDWWQEYLLNEDDLIDEALKAIKLKRFELENGKHESDGLSFDKQMLILKLRIDELEKEKASLFQGRQKNIETKKIEKPLHTREKNTLLKMIIGMAVEQYGYNPKQARSRASSDIVSDLANCGISVDPDTIRKWLKEASDLLPQDALNEEE
ncbi:hypothetical protein [Curvivirga aplysinae]|uniref:hypothetical protein n=1 Tax=Curvivirga aplysinae TaxID=2529852 RepID=UPI0012BD4664|nr:hypothetical protein [Curvivirga aplysinae]MTI08704.1 hypothetical protein [Curvivirga aplysinae]